MKAGSACLDISPPLGTLMPGLFHERRAEAIHDPLYVKSFVLEQEGHGLAIVVCDLIGVKRDFLDQARARISESIGLPQENVLVCCTHTHSGAQMGEDSYTESVIGRIADVVQLAWRDKQVAEIGWGSANEDRVVFNRRFRMKDGSVRTNPGPGNPDALEPAGPVDPEVGVVCMQQEGGNPIGLLANYSLHYVGGGNNQCVVSADYFGRFSKLIQRLRGATFVAAMSNGACGDINNHDVQGGHRPENGQYQHTERVAGLIAAAALWAWNEIPLASDAPIGAAMEEVTLQRKAGPTEEDLVRVEEIKKLERATMADRAFMRRITDRMVNVSSEVKTWVQALRVGDLALVGIPGELLVELGLDIKKQSPFGHTFILELANDSIGYIPTRRAYDEGGYEPEASLFQSGVGEQIVEVAVRLLGTLHGN